MERDGEVRRKREKEGGVEEEREERVEKVPSEEERKEKGRKKLSLSLSPSFRTTNKKTKTLCSSLLCSRSRFAPAFRYARHRPSSCSPRCRAKRSRERGAKREFSLSFFFFFFSFCLLAMFGVWCHRRRRPEDFCPGFSRPLSPLNLPLCSSAALSASMRLLRGTRTCLARASEQKKRGPFFFFFERRSMMVERAKEKKRKKKKARWVLFFPLALRALYLSAPQAHPFLHS